MKAFQVHNDQMKVLRGTEFAPATLTRYNTAYDHVTNFIKWKNNSLLLNKKTAS